MVKIVVDLWKTGLHGVEVGIKKKEELMSRSRRFTKDMDIFGEVKLDKKKYGYIAFKKKDWEKENSIEKKITVRLFSEDIDWLGNLDENIGRAIAISLVNEEPSPAFVITLPGMRVIYHIERIRPRFAETDSFLFTYIDKKNVLRPLLIKSKRFSIGSDWQVVDIATDKKIAEVDGKVLDIGGRWEIKTKEKDELLWRSLVLFSALMRFYDDVKEKIEALTKSIKKTKKYLSLSKSDTAFFYNPRLRR